MRLDEMKKHIPETPGFIREMMRDEVEKQLQCANESNLVKKGAHQWAVGRVAVAVMLGIVAMTSVVYAGVKFYHLRMEKTGKYGMQTSLVTNTPSDGVYSSRTLYDIEIVAEYIPEGMAWWDEYHLDYQGNRTGGFSFEELLIEEQVLDKVITDRNVIESEKRTFGQHEGVYLAYHSLEENAFNQRIYLLCPEVHRLITIYIGDNVAKEEAIKVAEHLSIAENDKVAETQRLSTWSARMEQRNEISYAAPTTIGETDLRVYQEGDSFALRSSYEDEHGSRSRTRGGEISARVDAVQVVDDLKLLEQRYIPEEWENVLGEDGKLLPNTIAYIRSGDGVDMLDEIVKTEKVEQKLVYVTVTYTNESNYEMNHILHTGGLMLLEHENGLYQVFDPKEQSGEGYDRVSWNGAAKHSVRRYFDVQEAYGEGGNYIPSLKPGESIQVNMAWIVNESDLKRMYLDLSGGVYEFSDMTLEAGVVDISQ